METMHTGDTIPFPTPQKSDTADLSDKLVQQLNQQLENNPPVFDLPDPGGGSHSPSGRRDSGGKDISK